MREHLRLTDEAATGKRTCRGAYTSSLRCIHSSIRRSLVIVASQAERNMSRSRMLSDISSVQSLLMLCPRASMYDGAHFRLCFYAINYVALPFGCPRTLVLHKKACSVG